MPRLSNHLTKTNEQEAAEADVDSFRKDLGPFVVATEMTRMAMVFTDAKEPTYPIIFANDSFLTLTGYQTQDVLGHAFNSLLAPGVTPESLKQVEAAFDCESDSDPEIHYRRKDGSEFWASIFVSPVRDETGRVVQHFISLVDLTSAVENPRAEGKGGRRQNRRPSGLAYRASGLVLSPHSRHR